MAVKLGMVMKLAVLALLLAAVSATASTADLFDLLAANNPEVFELVKHETPNATPCCTDCTCTKSIPPQCVCRDVFIGQARCKGCDACLCTKSWPPQCRCTDVRDYCVPRCRTNTVSAEAAEIIFAN